MLTIQPTACQTAQPTVQPTVDATIPVAAAMLVLEMAGLQVAVPAC